MSDGQSDAGFANSTGAGNGDEAIRAEFVRDFAGECGPSDQPRETPGQG
jgi:hypothetical protein